MPVRSPRSPIPLARVPHSLTHSLARPTIIPRHSRSFLSRFARLVRFPIFVHDHCDLPQVRAILRNDLRAFFRESLTARATQSVFPLHFSSLSYPRCLSPSLSYARARARAHSLRFSHHASAIALGLYVSSSTHASRSLSLSFAFRARHPSPAADKTHTDFSINLPVLFPLSVIHPSIHRWCVHVRARASLYLTVVLVRPRVASFSILLSLSLFAPLFCSLYFFFLFPLFLSNFRPSARRSRSSHADVA